MSIHSHEKVDFFSLKCNEHLLPVELQKLWYYRSMSILRAVKIEIELLSTRGKSRNFFSVPDITREKKEHTVKHP